ncbi:MAG: FAD-dependent oxidoreductase [Clostridia bacterium]|nr:FAD-dependent oxidoreductase [Clostridia bacterium]
MYRISQIKLQLNEDKSKLPIKIENLLRRNLGISDLMIDHYEIVKESLDSRKKDQIKRVYTVDFSAVSKRNPKKHLKLEANDKLHLSLAKSRDYESVKLNKSIDTRPVVVGFGPAGIFAALTLARGGARPIVLERGEDALSRSKSVRKFWDEGVLNPESNVQFGEGGAGTFSDGKLTTGIKDPRIYRVLRDFVWAGAKESILYEQKPHLGTDLLVNLVVKLRKEIERLGGEVRFNSKLEAFEREGDKWALKVNGEKILTDDLILAIGHSARDTFQVLKESGISMEQKPFSIGFRIEHPQDLIDIAQYGKTARELGLPVASYKLSCHLDNGRGVYSFCMCPGGEIIDASSVDGYKVVNGMSNSARDSGKANSAILCDVKSSDFESEDVLAGVRFQEKYEKMAYEYGKGKVPVSNYGEFKMGKGPVAMSLPAFAKDSINMAMPEFAKKIKGFDGDQVLIKGIESRSSSPVRILRNELCESINIPGIYPCGEGAGYAGGIMSAAVDGIRVAESVINKYNNK